MDERPCGETSGETGLGSFLALCLCKKLGTSVYVLILLVKVGRELGRYM